MDGAKVELRAGDELRATFEVPFVHRVLFADAVFGAGNETLSRVIVREERSACIAFIDAAVAQLAPAVDAALRGFTRFAGVVVVPGGEQIKRDTSHFDAALAALHGAGIDRHGYCVIVGGGAVLDAVGLAAALVHRGVRVVRVPTTVLGQNDAGVGIKCGIDAFGKKNFLGAFAPPWAVVNDFTLLRTLPAEGWRDGVAEAVKVALLKEAGFFDWIEANVEAINDRDEAAFRYLIRRCAELHVQHIATGGDPFELGSARPLDFGHWSAHRIEQLSGFTISHGSAVAIGIAIDMMYAAHVGLAPAALAQRVMTLLGRLRFPFSIPFSPAEILQGLADFREHLGGRLTLTLVPAPGQSADVFDVDPVAMTVAIHEASSFAG